jgi:tetratricopeptide (TPR) repeat protein
MHRPAKLALLVILAMCLGAPVVQAANPFTRPRGEPARGKAKDAARLVAQADRELERASIAASIRDKPGAEAAARRAIELYGQALDSTPSVHVAYRAFVATLHLDDKTYERHQQTVRFGTLVRKLDPLDPRDTMLAQELASSYTQLARHDRANARALLELAVAEYRLLRSRIDVTESANARGLALATSNGAELLMGLGPEHLDEAIGWYELAMELYPGEVLHFYGAAIAYDRAGHPGRAEELMRQALRGENRVDAARAECGFYRVTQTDLVFFLPEGDEYAYKALACEVAGDRPKAITHWRRFLNALPDSPYAGRARARLRALEDRK